MPAGPSSSNGQGEIPDWLFYGIFSIVPILIAVSWASAQLSALVTSARPAGVGPADATRAVPHVIRNAGDPAAAYGPGNHVPGPVAYWTTTGVVVVAVLVGALAVMAAVSRLRGRPGMANRGDLGALRAKAVVAQAKVVRPDLPEGASAAERVAAAGVSLGRQWRSGPALWGTKEDSYLVIAPPRVGKTVRMVVPTVVDHDGPAVVTSTRWDVLRLTAAARAQRGPVWVFDADQRGGTVLPDGAQPARWSPVAGADDPQTAMVRARSLANAAGAGKGVTSGEFWATHAERVLRCYLHAAALGDRTISDVRQWADAPDLDDPVELLRTSPHAPSWASELQALGNVADRQRDGVWGVTQQALAALADPRVLAACNPPKGGAFRPDDLLASNGTLFLVGQAETQDVIAPLVAALVEAVAEAARHRAASRPGGRLAPTLLLALDEVANIAPLPTLPTLLAEGGGTGITTMIVLQSRSQAKARWGEENAEAIIAACTHRLVLGGGGELRELEDLSSLVGERDEEVRSHSWQPWGAGQSGSGSSTSTSLRRVPILTPSDLQAMEKGRGVLSSPSTRPVEVRVPAWWERPDADQLQADQQRRDAQEPDDTN